MLIFSIQSILLGAPGTFAWRGMRLLYKHMVLITMHIGNVFRRNSIGQTISSSNGVGSGSISWQGYEVITGRITSQSLGFVPYLLTKCTI